MPIVSVGQAEIGLYSIPLSKPAPQIIFHWKIDCSNLRDPMGQKDLRALDGRSEKVQAFILSDPRTKPIIHAVRMIVAEKQKWTSIAFYDFHARLISTAMAELVARELDAAGYSVSISHFGLEGK